MFNKTKIYVSLAGLGFFLALTTYGTLVQTDIRATKVKMSASAVEHTSQFQKIPQPLGLKIAVITGGLGLIGAELWWFMFNKN